MAGVLGLVALAYAASVQPGRVDIAVERRGAAMAPHRVHPAAIPSAEVIVGHPRDGIVELREPQMVPR